MKVSGFGNEERPRTGHAFEFVLAGVMEFDVAAEHKVSDCRGDEQLGWCRQGGDACRDVDGETSEVVATAFALTGVTSGPYLDAFPLKVMDEGLSAVDGSGWTVEGSYEAVARGVDFAAPEAVELLANDAVMNV